MNGVMLTKTVRCTEENAAEVQALVKQDPELLALVKQLQQQGLFPGLRAMSFTFTGDEQTLAKGLGAWPQKNGSKAQEIEK